MKTKGKIAIGEILVLLVATFAFAWMVSGEIGIVRGTDLDEFVDVNPGTESKTSGTIGGFSGIQLFKEIGKRVTSEGAKTIAKNFGTATFWYTAFRSLEILGVSQDYTKPAANAAFLGSAAASGVNYFTEGGTKKGFEWVAKKYIGGITGSGLVGIGVAVLIFAATYKNKKIKTVVFDCKTWDAPTGGSKCEECNKQGILGCSEYQCHALGQNCIIKEGACVWDNKRDTKPPVISVNNNALLEGQEYKDKNERGVKLIQTDSKDGCFDAFTPLIFGIDTDKPATCKMDLDREKVFADMGVELAGRNYNHTQGFPTLGPDAINSEIPEGESLDIPNTGEYEWYIRCQDRNGNENPTEFVLKFCVAAGPDLNSPLIVASNVQETSYIKYNQETIDFKVYTNKPSQCKWTRQDKSYDDMENTMACSGSVTEMNLQGTYPCSTEIDELTNTENKIYVKCKSYPLMEEGNRVVNEESTEFIFQGTSQLLKIESVTPLGETIRGPTKNVPVELKVKTLAGAKEGIAQCKYGTTDDYESGWMLNSNSYEHTQMLALDEGSYTYYVKCMDAGGNEATATTTFQVETDAGAPTVVRVFKKENSLEITTSENAECVYNTNKELGCDYIYSDGSIMTSLDGLKHSTSWDTSSNYYIKCKDDYENQPASGCSIIVKPSEF